MRYYIIGKPTSTDEEYEYAEQWLKLNGHDVINPRKIILAGLNDTERKMFNLTAISRADGVLVLDKACRTFEFEYAKQLGKKVKYLSKQWRLKKADSNKLYKKENV